MHVHAFYTESMRTTIELTDRQRAKLLEIAARRGEKGFSHLVREAVERYLDQEAYRRELLDQARSVLGSLSDGEADELDASVRQIRETWR
jgi:metal-responsive CopG/Arc/MetJ family transcriptional regulator